LHLKRIDEAGDMSFSGFSGNYSGLTGILIRAKAIAIRKKIWYYNKDRGTAK
jgi:hypothetical protein